MKLYIVMLWDDPIAAFPTRNQATEYAETHYGSKQDGICVDGVKVWEFEVNEGSTLQERTV